MTRTSYPTNTDELSNIPACSRNMNRKNYWTILITIQSLLSLFGEIPLLSFKYVCNDIHSPPIT